MNERHAVTGQMTQGDLFSLTFCLALGEGRDRLDVTAGAGDADDPLGIAITPDPDRVAKAKWRCKHVHKLDNNAWVLCFV